MQIKRLLIRANIYEPRKVLSSLCIYREARLNLTAILGEAIIIPIMSLKAQEMETQRTKDS